MKTRYSKITGCFYPFDFPYAELPVDIIEVPIEAFNAAMARPVGSTFEFIGGDLVITPAQEPTVAQKANADILAQISELEASVTARRLREAVLGIDNGWLKGVNDQVAALRAKLVKD